MLLTISLAVAIIAVAFYFASSYSNDSLAISQAQDAADRLASASDYVFALGPNSKDYVFVFLPEGIESVNVSGKRILLKVRTSAGISDVFAYSKSDLIGSLPSGRGKQKILVQYLATGKIVLGEAGLNCVPEYISHSASSGDSFIDTITLSNNADYIVTGISASLSGTVQGLAAISSVVPSSLGAGISTSVNISYNIPLNQPSGVYGGYIVMDSENDGACLSQVTVHISGEASCGALCAGQGYSGGTCRATPALCIDSGEDYSVANDYACANVSSPRCCCGPTQDILGPVVSMISATPSNATSSDNLSISALCNDTNRGGSYIKSAEGRIDGGPLTAFSATDGAFTTSVTELVNHQFPPLPPGQHIVELRCTDSADNTGEFFYYYFNVSMADMLGPIVTYMSHSDPLPTTLAFITEIGTASETYTGNNNIVGCTAKIDSGDWFNATPTDGAFNSPNELFNFTVGQMKTGMHTIYARCTDSKGNVGGIYNDTFGVSAADIILIMDVSGSMADAVTNALNNTQVSTTSGTFTMVKTITVYGKNGDNANLSVEMYAGTSGCKVEYQAKIGSTVIAYGNRTSTSWGTLTTSLSLAAYEEPINIDLYIRKVYGSSCTVYNRNFALTQLPTKMFAAQGAANQFVDITDNSTLAGLVSYSTTASTVRTLMGMVSGANKTDLKNAINGLSPTLNTCIECGIDNAVNELITSRSRFPEAMRVAILMTDGQSNTGDSYTGASYARNHNVTVYTIGFGTGVNADELINIALVTGGTYYYAPDSDTLAYIYRHIGQ